LNKVFNCSIETSRTS